MAPDQTLPLLLGLAVLLPLGSFFLILGFGNRMGKAGEYAAYLATAAIGSAAALSFLCLFVIWLPPHGSALGQSHTTEHAGSEHALTEHPGPASGHTETAGDAQHASGAGHEPPSYTGDYYVLGKFGQLRMAISYYVDALTVCMFCMVTLIATLIHCYAMGYMHDELHEITDHEVTLTSGAHLKRRGRYHRFFQYLSLFCFSMLGLVLSGNIAMVFVFWELVGICSYFLIGFYVERKSASTAANKAFIVNRVGDFGMIIGLMVLWSTLGTFAFGDISEPLLRSGTQYQAALEDGSVPEGLRTELGQIGIELPADAKVVETHVDGPVHATPEGAADAPHEHEWVIADPLNQQQVVIRRDGDALLVARVKAGIFSQVRPRTPLDHDHDPHDLIVPDGMVLADASREVAEEQRVHLSLHEPAEALTATRLQTAAMTPQWRKQGYGYWLLVLAGVGIFCGCVGKSAQFPLHVWLPDAMEGPTPVSALVHSATMVAAGVYLVGRFYPVFLPEVLLVIAAAGCITLFMAATIAITATDIKRVLAYSTVSQLGYMMLGLGLGGWLAGLMHLITHAFFKSLLFMCSGSVIHAVHTNEMPEMGGLWKKMPVTAFTMLIGCLAIAGISVPFVVGFSGYYSKDMILEQAFSFANQNGSFLGWVFFCAAAGGAALTAFYMFRMWYLTFVGSPRNAEKYAHAHESPAVMYVPLVVLSVFAVTVAWGHHGWLEVLVGCAIAAGISLAVWMRFGSASGATGHTAAPHAAATHSRVSGDHASAAGGHGHAAHAAPGHEEHTGDHAAHAGHSHHGSGNLALLPLALTGLVFVTAVIWQSTSLRNVVLQNLLESARPAGTAATVQAAWVHMTWPNEHFAHEPEQRWTIVVPVTLIATATALGGIALATVMYALGWLSPDEVRRQFRGVYGFLVKKWWFDELYDWLFVRPTHVVSRLLASVDRNWIDGLIDGLAGATKWVATTFDRWADRTVVDGSVNVLAGWTHSIGLALRAIQTGRIRQYVMFIVLGAITIFLLITFWNSAMAN